MPAALPLRPVLLLDPAAAAAGSLALLFSAVLLLAYLLYGRLGPVLPVATTLPFTGHLRELRNRTLRLVVLLAFWIVFFLSFRLERAQVGPFTVPRPIPDLFGNAASQVYAGLAALSLPPGVRLLVSSPTEAVGAQLEVALLLSLIVTLPFLAFEAWAFFTPGLERREQKALGRLFPLGVVLFILGAAFGLLLMTPLLFRVLYAFAAPLGAETYLSVGFLVGTVTTMMLVFGAAFELPLVMVGLTQLGVTTPALYVQYWRHSTLAIFIVAALATDPTVLSQMIVGVLLLALYWGGVLGAYLAAPRRSRKETQARAGPA